MRVISVAVVGALLLLLLLAALPRRAWARAAASLSPQALPDTRHGPRRPGAEGDEGVLAHAAEGGLLPLEGREQRPAVSHPHGPLHPRQEAPDHRLAQDTDEEEDDDEDEDEDDEEQDVEWSAEDLEVIKQKILDGLGLTTPPLRSQVLCYVPPPPHPPSLTTVCCPPYPHYMPYVVTPTTSVPLLPLLLLLLCAQVVCAVARVQCLAASHGEP
ncbi:hypothetical protein E2C01_070613 [Portunus trituberculatus]|uniref:Uncharacterized protein n=1 Tax=Portunus trituberculatus TaxID=210409 RepID=A0A5B7I2K2_PORTR|nr:hypothetical protein [Portunus trituberculatus]